MDTKKLEKILNDEWLKIDTWYTMHPLDEKRFHNAIKICYNEFKRYISEEQIKTAINNVIGNNIDMENSIDRYSKKADCILSYLSDINEM